VTVSLIGQLFGTSPCGPLIQHTKKVHECVSLVAPLLEACIAADYDKIHTLQDQVSKIEYDADVIKQGIREHLPKKFFLPVERGDLNRFLHSQDEIADYVEDFAVILFIRKTKIHPELVEAMREFVQQILTVTDKLLAAADQIDELVETTFGGAEAELVLKQVSGLNQEEWKADRMQRKLCMKIYGLESELDPITILFYEKMLHALSGIANASENTGEILRQMIVKG